jgi:hypothetical protein
MSVLGFVSESPPPPPPSHPALGVIAPSDIVDPGLIPNVENTLARELRLFIGCGVDKLVDELDLVGVLGFKVEPPVFRNVPPSPSSFSEASHISPSPTDPRWANLV